MTQRCLVATRKGLFTLRRNGGSWRIEDTAFLADKCPMTMFDPRDGAIYAALNHGHFGDKMHRSDDGGSTWREIATPAYPEMPAGYDERNEIGKVVPWKLKLIWALDPGGADEPGAIWCGTLPGGLFRSEDRGASWTLNRSLWDRPERVTWFGGGYDEPGIHSICVDPRDSRHVTVGVSCGGAWHTEDGGRSWSLRASGMRAEYMPPERAREENIQDPHLIVQCAAHPDAMWTQHHNGIFRTIDRGRSWTEIEAVEPSSFGFACAVHPSNPDVAWFVPAIKDERRIPVDGRMVVTRTRDGGRSFEILRDGLPQEHAYDLVYRHALAIDGSGERLAMGSTTGSLWLSENAGDHWTLISAHLPPVYAVRFAE